MYENASFQYSTSKEPHQKRCREILKAHPALRKAFGPNPWSILCILAVVSAQTGLAIFASFHSWWTLLAMSYLIGAVLNHSLFVLIHEATHNLVVRSQFGNRLAGIAANLAIGMPMAMAFRTFHLLHHMHQGDPEWDADLASEAEAQLVGRSAWRKALWLFVFVFIEGLYRPRLVKRGKTPVGWLVVNYVAVFGFAALLVSVFGWKTFAYLFASTFFAVGLHPLGARWIQEHYVIKGDQETYSYYGPANLVAFNVGYHNEHHDLPNVAWSRLPLVKRTAPEFYDSLYSHTSYVALLREFIFNPELTLFSRVIRPASNLHSRAQVAENQIRSAGVVHALSVEH